MHPQEFLSATQEYRAIFQDVEACTEKVGVSPGEWLVLGIVHGRPTHMTGLKQQLLVSLPEVTRLTSRLHGRGLVDIVQSDTDKRSRTVHLSHKGKRILKDISNIRLLKDISKQGGKVE